MRVIELQSLLVVATFVLSGCAAMEKQETTSTEQVLAAAGFKMKLADSPAKLAHLKTLTQRKLVSQTNKGQVRYVYADAKYCKCVYAGREVAYQRYQKLALEKRIAAAKRTAVRMNENAAMEWDMWGEGYMEGLGDDPWSF